MSSSSTSKATWNPQTLDVFCDLCIKEVDIGHRPGTHLTSHGYENLIKEFIKETGLDYNRTQMKNKWDSLRTDWKLWKNLIGKETGLGWNHMLRTVDASEEWWEKKIKENMQFNRFQKNGIDLELEKKLYLMFMNTVATGEHVWVPSFGFPLESNDASESLRVESTADSYEYIVSNDSKGIKGKRVAIKGNKV
ncbi:L10-interacting MYB domain-containing protein-like [Citrus clementina]|uniref:L10-interacting MYB domain-containing protein-like n=1 Tax=Citrus clementina TaxID=85681 RepID=UPI000CECE744|nr:L10-interacting MYB domain-containing protein-like [Citrus x clementina]